MGVGWSDNVLRMPTDLGIIVQSEHATEDLRTYFSEDAEVPYTGRRFEAFAGGGDRLDTRNAITADDLLAVQMLGVKFPAEVAIDLIEGKLGEQAAGLLCKIPSNVALGTPDAKASMIRNARGRDSRPTCSRSS